MFDGGRLQGMMTERGFSQSELARRVGVSQTTIRKLVSSAGYGSKHLHRIARVLGTTPAYLEGETDDPDADAPDPPAFTPEHYELIDCYEALPPAQQAILLGVAMSMAGRGPEGRLQSPERAYRHDGDR